MTTGTRYSQTRMLSTNYKCRGCNTMIVKYINTTSEQLVGKFLCLCTNKQGDPIGPQFPLYEVE